MLLLLSLLALRERDHGSSTNAEATEVHSPAVLEKQITQCKPCAMYSGEATKLCIAAHRLTGHHTTPKGISQTKKKKMILWF